MMRQEAAAQLRAEYRRAGWNSRMISVRSTRGEVRVTIKAVQVPHAKAKAMAEKYEDIARDGYGEILLGGNLYVNIDQSPERREILARRHLDAIEAALPEVKASSSVLVPITERASIGQHISGYGYQLWADGGTHCGMSFGSLEPLAVAIALLDPDQSSAPKEAACDKLAS